MARICFVILNHTSAMLSAITFTKSLVSVGHQVTIIANDASCKNAKENGLDAISYGSFVIKSAPTGFKVAYNDRFAHWLPPSAEYINQQNEVIKKITSIQQEGKFDLVIIDTMVLYPYIIPSITNNIPVIRFSPNLASSPNKNYPAISSIVTPRKINLIYKLQSRLSRWQRNAAVIPYLLGTKITSLFSEQNHHRNWKKQIKAAGLKLHLFEYGITVSDVPELVAAPAEFEFPLLKDILPKRSYIGACVDPKRRQSSISGLDDFNDNPLIYCAMGTFSKRYSHAKDIFETIIAYAKNNPKYNFLIQYGDVNIQADSLPSNIIIERFVSQIEVLRHASLMITHGGLGSVREASYFGVPMLVIPGWNDQYGNAARIDFHGTGIRIRPKQLNIHTIDDLLTKLLNDPDIKQRVSNMKNIFQAQTNAEPGIKAIEEILSLKE